MPEAKPGPITVPDLALVRDLYAAGRVSEALMSCRQLLSEDPARPQAWAIAGMLSLKLGDLVHAEASYRRALALDPAFTEAHFNLGNLLVQLGRLQEGAEALSRAAALAPDRAAMHTNLGAAQTRLGAHEAAEHSLRRALALAPSPQAHRNLGTALRAQGRLAAARDSFQRALELAPGWPKALQSLANTAMELGDWALARDTCQRWLAIAPRNVEALGLLSIALDEQGDRAGADTLLNADLLLRRVALEEAPEGGALGAFNAALVREALTDPSLRVPAADDPLYHCPTLLLSGDVGEEQGSAGAQLTEWVRSQIRAYVDALQRDLPQHPYVVGPAPRWSLKSWFAVLDREGQLEPHVHYESYVSAVYYAQVPTDMRGDGEPGHFELSGGPSRFPCRHPRTPRTFAPKEGHLLLFPSYFYHRTLPFRASTPRVSIAFDAVPRDDSDATTAAKKA